MNESSRRWLIYKIICSRKREPDALFEQEIETLYRTYKENGALTKEDCLCQKESSTTECVGEVVYPSHGGSCTYRHELAVGFQ